MTAARLPGAPLLSRGQALWLWAGQMLALLATASAEFGLGIWMFERNGSSFQFSLIIVWAVLPGLLVTPWAGSAADRLDRRRIVALADGTEIALLGLTAVLHACQALHIWHVYAVNGLLSVCLAYRIPAYQSAVGALLPRNALVRINGLLRSGSALVHLAMPALAVGLLAQLGLSLLLGLCVAALLAARLSMLCVAIPRLPSPGSGAESDLAAFLGAAREMLAQPQLAFVTCYSGVLLLLRGMAMGLCTPLILAKHTPQALALIHTAGAAGLLLSSALVAALGLPRRLMQAVIGLDLGLGLALILLGLAATPVLAGLAMFLAMAGVALRSSADQHFWLLAVPSGMQGRILALNAALMNVLPPMAAMAGAALSDYVLTPLLREAGGAASPGAGGAGLSLIFLGAGVLSVAAAGLSLRRGGAVDRHLEGGPFLSSNNLAP